MVLNQMVRAMFGKREKPRAAGVNVLHRIQRTCVLAAVEFDRQSEAIRAQREQLECSTSSGRS